MKIFKKENALKKYLNVLKQEGNSIGFVPTMGAFHNGHLSLIRHAKRFNDIVVVSIFVNPAQFAAGEDYEKYPRNLKRDLSLASQKGVDVVYCPSVSEVYPRGFCTYVTVDGFKDVLCAKTRPGHFKGVATVCAKLFNIVNPDVVYFGRKDAQQAVIIKKMLQDLNMPYKIKVLPTVREKDGLAMSSRNSYLSRDEREKACIIYEALKEAEKMFSNGERDAVKIKKQVKNMLSKISTFKVDYIELVDSKTLLPVLKTEKGTLLAVAGWFKRVRLIDNMIF